MTDLDHIPIDPDYEPSIIPQLQVSRYGGHYGISDHKISHYAALSQEKKDAYNKRRRERRKYGR